MALTINSNVQSLNTMRALNKTQGTLAQTFRRISSGVRLDTAADDPGRLGSSALAESQARGMKQSMRNLGDGLSLAQTLEGGLGQVEAALQRLRELSVQGANETYNANDRASLQAEVEQLIAQIDKVVEQTQFNGIGLLDGSAMGLELFVDKPAGAGASESLSLDLVKIDTQEMSRRSHYVSERRGVYLGTLSTGDVKINGVEIRGTTESDDELSMSYRAGSAIAKANAINAVSETTGVTARAAANVVTANRAVSGFELNTQNYFSVNGYKISGFDIEDFDANGKLLSAINSGVEETGVKAQLDAYGQLQLIAEDGRNIQIRYSNMLTMLSIGLADTSGDEVNLKGIVEKSTVMPPIDLFGSIQSVWVDPDNAYGGNFSIGGEFDPGRDYVDYVVQVIQGGPLGVAQFRISGEDGSEIVPAEDFAFIETNGGPYPTSHTAGMEYFQNAVGGVNNGQTGAVVAVGGYNEGADRTYTLKVVQEGTTDGAQRAVVDIATNVDGTILTNVTLGTVTPINIGTVANQTGEDVTIQFAPTPRGQSVSQNGVANTQEYSGSITQTGANGVIISGTYSTDTDMIKRIEVVDSGYTQGTNFARIRVTNTVDGVTTTAASTFSITTAVGGRVSIGDGLFVEFDPETVSYTQAQNSVLTPNAAGTNDSYETSGLNVTVNSDPADFVGERGSGQYILEVTKAGRTDNAEYRVLFDPADGGATQVISTNNTLNAGVENLADGVSLNFEASTPVITNQNKSVNFLPSGDHYGDNLGDYAGFSFGGAYTGDLNDTTAKMEVVTEGRVLAAGETSTGDAATLRYTIAGTVAGATITGTTLARVGTYNLGEGVTFTIDAASASDLTELSVGGVDRGNTHTFAAGAVAGYNGDVTITLDPNTFDEVGKDLTLRLSEIGNVVVGGNGSIASGTLFAEVMDGATVVASASFSVTEGFAHTITTGLSITFNDSTYTPLSLTGAGTNGDSASIALPVGAQYNSAVEDGSYTIRFVNDTSTAVSQSGNGVNGSNDVAGGNITRTGSYSGLFGQQELSFTFEGTEEVQTGNTTGTGNVSLSGSYNGDQGDQGFSVELLGGATTVGSTISHTAGNTFKLTSASGYEGLAGDLNLDFTFEGVSTATTSAPSLTANVTNYVWQDTAAAFTIHFSADNTADFISGGVTFETGVDLSSGSYTLAAGSDFAGVSVSFTDMSGNESGGPDYSVSLTPTQTVSVTNTTTTASVTGVDISGGAIDMGGAAFSALGDLSGLSVSFDTASVDSNDTFRVALTSAKAKITGVGGNTTVDISTSGNASKTIDLSAHSNLFAGNADPGVDVVIANPNDQVSGVVSYDLNTKSTVTVTNVNTGASVTGVTLNAAGVLDLDGKLTAANKTTLFGGAPFTNTDPIGVDVTFGSFDRQIDDVFTLELNKTARLNIVDNAVGGAGSTYEITGSSLGNETFDLAGKIGGQDPGFDLVINNPILGINDSYTLDLKGGQLSIAGTEDVIDLNARSLQVGDEFTADLIADTLEVGTRYGVDVDAPMLEAGAVYSITENIGTLKVGEEINVTVNSAFEAPVYTTGASVNITDGLALEFTPGTFEVGDEFRFQARGYRGDFSVFGQYTDPAYPTTIELEVITTGDVDGGAVLRARRLDGRQIDDANPGAAFVDLAAVSTAANFPGGAGYIGQGVSIQFDANAGAGEAHRLYAGDKFYVDVIGSLSQNFSSQLVLESNDNILIEYSDINVDNQLGRMLYVGDPTLANAPGTLNSLTKAVLGVNTEFSIAKLDLTSQEGAEDALRIVDHAIETISDHRTKTGAVQNRITQELASLSEALFQTERYGSRIRDADIATEVATLTRAQIQQQAGAEMLRQINQLGALSLQLVESLLG